MSGKFLSVAVALLLGLASNAAYAKPPVGAYHGYAFGTYANLTVGPLASKLARTAITGVPCLGTNGKVISNAVNSLEADNPDNGKLVLKARTIVTTAQTSTTTDSALVTTTASIQGLNALAGLVTADAIKGEANTTATSTPSGTSFGSNGDGSNFVNLRINGTLIVANGNVAPNTTLTLPGGLGTVILNRQVETHSGNAIVVEMIRIVMTSTNDFGLPINTYISIAYAGSGFDLLPPFPSPGIASGSAWAADGHVTISNVLTDQIGVLAFTATGIGGGSCSPPSSGGSHSNTIIDGSIDHFLSVFTGDTTATAALTPTGLTVKTSATTQNAALFPTVNFPKGILTAAVVKAVSETDIVYGARERSTAGSEVSGLTVAGVPITVVAPNTTVAIPGIGEAILDEQLVPPVTSTAPTVVNGIHVRVTQNNPFHLPVGAEVIVSHADSASRLCTPNGC